MDLFWARIFFWYLFITSLIGIGMAMTGYSYERGPKEILVSNIIQAVISIYFLFFS